MRRHKEEILISESAALRVFNKVMGTACTTMAETVEYIEKHPEARKRFEEEPD